MLYDWLADLVVVTHLVFIVFVATGALAVLRWPRLAWVHIPAAVWGILIEFVGFTCPLTPLENALRQRAGESGYAGGFIEHYVARCIYPEGLTRRSQVVLGSLALGINAAVYGWLLFRYHVSQRGSR